jgi:tetratricopeptide (TPR) repeat protein
METGDRCRSATARRGRCTGSVTWTDKLIEHKYAEAKTVLLGALEDASGRQDKEYRLAYAFNNLGSVAQDQGRYFEAEKCYRRSIAYGQDGGERSLAVLARALYNLASLLYSAGKLGEVQELLRRSEAIQIEVLGRDHPEIGVLLLNRGALYFKQRKYSEAEQAYRRAWAVLEPHGKSRELELAHVAGHLGLICERSARKREATAHYNFARTVWEKRVQAGKATPEIYLSLAALYSILRQDLPATLILQAGLVVVERELGPGHPQVGDMLLLYASVLRKTGDKAEAKRTTKQAKAIRSNSQERLARHTIAISDLVREKRTK